MKHSQEGILFTDIVLEVFKLGGLLTSEGDNLTRNLGLTSARWKVLGAVALTDMPMTVPKIAQSMGQTRQSVQRLTDSMESMGILKYRNNPHHKKAKLVVLSPKGKRLYHQLDQKQISWANENSTRMASADLEVTLSVLRMMNLKLGESR